MKRITGFTLIELLIVVAIIAILAAIAVPNFLEAQVRAKVARAKADQRSMATAIEAYSIDWNRYPIGYNEGKMAPLNLWDVDHRWWSYSAFTTPIAYMTSIPTDPFRAKGVFGGGENNEFPPYHQYLTSRTLPPVSSKSANLVAAYSLGYTWCFYSSGPSRALHSPYPWAMFSHPVRGTDGTLPNGVYDSTNGTASFGFIIRSNKGIYSGNSD